MTSKLFAGKTALVTGASSGIGAATAERLANQGASLILHYNSKGSEAAVVAEKVRGAGVECRIVQADLGSEAGIQTLCKFARDHRIDILVNNAGSLVQRTKITDFTLPLWNQVMMLNFTSAFFASQAVIGGMVERQSGVIVNVSSVAARTGGNVGAMAYAAAKAAVSTMTKGFAKEFAGQGVRVNAVSPGTVDTPYHKAFSTEEGLNAVRAATPAGRLGTADEIARVITFLCSEDASFIHGQVLEINGGFLLA